MDLYKHAFRLTPMISSDLVADCFELARDIRELDMRAAPYDLADLGFDPVRIETAEGKATYVAGAAGLRRAGRSPAATARRGVRAARSGSLPEPAGHARCVGDDVGAPGPELGGPLGLELLQAAQSQAYRTRRVAVVRQVVQGGPGDDGVLVLPEHLLHRLGPGSELLGPGAEDGRRRLGGVPQTLGRLADVVQGAVLRRLVGGLLDPAGAAAEALDLGCAASR